ncbi:MAG TPA: magnesium-translocating P-type ATPase [Ruminococcaceae bacterium]|nr:magnesium-translocating P-type ATPase [Oscillospiraceae bacterium]
MKKQPVSAAARRGMSTGAQRLLRSSMMDTGALLGEYGNTCAGYDEETVLARRGQYGRNETSVEKPEPFYKKLSEAFINPFTVVLFILAAILFLTDVAFAAPGKKDPSTVIIIAVMVLISGTLRFVQEARSDSAAAKLRNMVHTSATVSRAATGKTDIPISDIVPGDIVYLAAGDMVPADVRVLSCKDLFIGQSSITGESAPVEKTAAPLAKAESAPLECSNLAFMGSNVVSGSAVCIAVATGGGTSFGAVAKSLAGKRAATSFDKGVDAVSRVLIRFMLCMVPVVFLINGFTDGDWLEAFMFAVSVAVGLTPEMLPMIVTTNLAKGAAAMAKKKTIVKRLDAMQNFGAMDVLCTDKTGTITKDKVVLERYLDVEGNEDERVLRHAFLNSYFQTGLKNLMDVAVINHAKSEPYLSMKEQYTKVDEIPFDFGRRRMSVVVRDSGGKTQLITKGAVEEMLAISSYAEYKGRIVRLTDEVRSEVYETAKRLSGEGLRVLAVAQRTNPPVEGVFSVRDESDMVLIGYLAFLDPPKETAASAIKALRSYGVDVKVLTGDGGAVTKNVCGKVGLSVGRVLLGSEIDRMDDAALTSAVEETSVFAKLPPPQKARIVRVLRQNGHVTGFMGDGINDAPAMRTADVAVSVDTAVDIAKESADIILLEKDLMVLEQGVVEGRRVFGNIIKYIKMTASSNFGNMFSVLAASVFLPFLPMRPIQLLLLNMIYDASCIAIPWDNMDYDYLKTPRKWDASSISSFMAWLGPTSSVFDIVTYIVMFFFICPAAAGGAYGAAGTDRSLFISLFNTGWFVESLWSQTLVIHMIRTPKVPFIESHASPPLLFSTSAAIAAGTLVPFTAFGRIIGMSPLPAEYFPWLAVILLCYMMLATFVKKMYRKKYVELL